MTKLQILETLKKVALNRLEKRVLSIAKREINDSTNGTFEERTIQVLNDFSHGCDTGVVSDLVYTCECVKWFNYYKKEIIEQLNEDISNGLFEMKEGREQDGEYYNYIELKTLNGMEQIRLYSGYVSQKQYSKSLKTVLAWYSFEQANYKFMNELGL